MVKESLARLASVGEATLDRLPFGDQARSAIESARRLRNRGESLVTELESVALRLAAIERRLGALEKASRNPRSKRAAPAPRLAKDKPRTPASARGLSDDPEASRDSPLPADIL